MDLPRITKDDINSCFSYNRIQFKSISLKSTKIIVFDLLARTVSLIKIWASDRTGTLFVKFTSPFSSRHQHDYDIPGILARGYCRHQTPIQTS